jgi:hypothetical protein
LYSIGCTGTNKSITFKQFLSYKLHNQGGESELNHPMGALPFSSTHSLNHFLAKLHWWWKWFRISPKNKTKINMEKTSIISEEEVV